MVRTEANQTTDIERSGTKDAQAQRAHPVNTRPPHPRGSSERMVDQTMSPPFAANARPATGSLDGDGAADHDQPYRFGFRPLVSAPYPFNTRQYARLLVLRGRLQDHVGASLELVPVAVGSGGMRPAA
jgi:hypothetical protein